MNYNEECMFLRKKLIKRPLVGKSTQEIQASYICAYKINFIGNDGCPPKNVCKGFKPAITRIIHFENH